MDGSGIKHSDPRVAEDQQGTRLIDKSAVYKRSLQFRNLSRKYANERTEKSRKALLKSMVSEREAGLLIPSLTVCSVDSHDDDDGVEMVENLFLPEIEPYDGDDIIADLAELMGKEPEIDGEEGMLESAPNLTSHYFEKLLHALPIRLTTTLDSPTSPSVSSKNQTEESTPVTPSPEYSDGGLNQMLIGALLKCQFIMKLTNQEKRAVIREVRSMTEEEVQRHQDMALSLFREALTKMAPKKKKMTKSRELSIRRRNASIKKISDRVDLQKDFVAPPLKLSSCFVTFGLCEEDPLTPGVKVSKEITIRSRGRGIVTFRVFDQENSDRQYTLTVSPRSGELKRGQTAKLKLDLHLTGPVDQVDDMIMIETLGGPRYLVYVRAFCEKFGVDPSGLKMANVEGIGEIPAVLHMLRNILLHYDGQERPGIFRESGSHRLIEESIRLISRGQFKDCRDVTVVSGLIKRWFRDLPVKVFDKLSFSDIMAIDARSHPQCEKLVEELEGLQKRLFFWLMDLMLVIVRHKDINLMPAHNIAIVFSPNLYTCDDHGRAFKISSQLSKLIETLLLEREATEAANNGEEQQ